MIALDSLHESVSQSQLMRIHASRPSSPNDEVTVRMIDQRRNASVRIVLGIFRALLLLLSKVEIPRLVLEPELREDVRDLPAECH